MIYPLSLPASSVQIKHQMGMGHTFDREQYVGVGNCRNTDRRSGTAGSGQLET